jgi:hypothetical protein
MDSMYERFEELSNYFTLLQTKVQKMISYNAKECRTLIDITVMPKEAMGMNVEDKKPW